MEPELFFCVGATKAGTTFLHAFLRDHPDCGLPPLKELHYFDTLEDGPKNWFARQLRRKRNQALTLSETAPKGRRDMLVRRAADIDAWLAIDQDPKTHAPYRHYLRHHAAGRRLTGDMTPAYGLLPVARLREMADLAPAPRFLYLLRDPVERAWSNTRMKVRRAGFEGAAAQTRAIEVFDRFLDGTEEQIGDRSNYAATLEALTEAVPAERLHVEFFEELFAQTALDRITDFLGISRHPAATGRVVHKGLPLTLDPERRAHARARLRDQYDAVEAHLGQLPPSWLREKEHA